MSKGEGEQGSKRTRLLPLLACSFVHLLSLCGCVTQPATVSAPSFDFSKVKQISVASFQGPGGQAATDEFVRQLLGTGIEVTDARHPGRVMLEGEVIDYKSNNQLMVFLGDDNSIVMPSGQRTPEEAALAAHKSAVASVMATVGIQARLVDNATHHILWANSFSYEGLDLPTALGAVVGELTDSLAKTLPQMNRPKPL